MSMGKLTAYNDADMKVLRNEIAFKRTVKKDYERMLKHVTKSADEVGITHAQIKQWVGVGRKVGKELHTKGAVGAAASS